MNSINIVATIKINEVFDINDFLYHFRNSLANTDYLISNIFLEESESEQSNFVRKLTGQKWFELSFTVSGKSVDFRQVIGGFHVAREKLGCFEVLSIKND